MEEYKGLKIPVFEPESKYPEGRQKEYCDSSTCESTAFGKNEIDCSICLFNNKYLEQFIEWEKENIGG